MSITKHRKIVIDIFLCCGFISGRTIDLMSIGILAEDGRKLYLQNIDAKFSKASDWVWRNVFPSFQHFDMRGDRSCIGKPGEGMSAVCKSMCFKEDCPWRSRYEIRDEVESFCDPDKYGKPEFWGYFADYDWVVTCQLHGTMMQLPKGWPMYCRDIKQLCVDKGDPELPKQTEEHHALADAEWNKTAYEFLMALK